MGKEGGTAMLADKLRGERERKGLSIKDVASATSIRALYIEGLESGDYSKLPAEVYIKGFIRNYASYLGLDPKEMMKEYLSENHPDKLAEVEASEEAAQKMEEDRKEHKEDLFHETLAVASVSDDAEEISSSDLLNPPAHRHRRLNILVAGIILILVIAGAGYLLADSGPDSQQGTASKSAAQQDNAKEAQAAQTAEQEKQPEPQVDGVEVSAKFNERCWVQVKVDGKVEFAGVVEKGQTRQYKGSNEVSITAGNAGAVSYTVNGKDEGVAGEKGQVAVKTFKKAAQ